MHMYSFGKFIDSFFARYQNFILIGVLMCLRCKKNPVCFSSKKGKKNYFDRLVFKNVTDNEKFWKTVKPFFTDKGWNHDKIILMEDNEIIS